MLQNYPRNLLRDVCALLHDIHERGFACALRDVMRPDASGSWQFTKYLIIGGLSVLIFLLVCAIFRMLAISVMGADYASHRLFWNTLEIAVGFIPTNFFTYMTNRRWVFVDGRHHPRKEFYLFTAAAMVSIAIAEIVAYAFIQYSPLGDFLIKLAVIAVCTIANFLFRKWVVFSR
jgi:putative flippase GtrA